MQVLPNHRAEPPPGPPAVAHRSRTLADGGAGIVGLALLLGQAWRPLP